MPCKPPNKLAVRLPNWVGDVVMALPALHALQSIGLELTLFGKPWIHDLLAGESMQLVSLTPSFRENVHIIKAHSEQTRIMLLTNSFSSALLARCAGFKPTGYRKDGRTLLLYKGLRCLPNQHEVEAYWAVARHTRSIWYPDLSPMDETPPAEVKLNLSQTAQVAYQALLQQKSISSPYWVLCPFAHGLSKEGVSRHWPHWLALSQWLSKNHILHYILPGPKEQEMAKVFSPYATILENIPLGTYAVLLANASVVIANDTGPMHLACAVGAPTLGLFGATSPQKTRPWGGQILGELGAWPSLDDVIERLEPALSGVSTRVFKT